MNKGKIFIGQVDLFPFLYLVVGEGENGDDLYLTLDDLYDVYVGDCFGTRYGVSADEEISAIEEMAMVGDGSEIARISPEEVDRILEERNSLV